jgi:hypothetical protein
MNAKPIEKCSKAQMNSQSQVSGNILWPIDFYLFVSSVLGLRINLNCFTL